MRVAINRQWSSKAAFPQGARQTKSKQAILIPAIILYEVYKVIKREVGEEKALLAAGYMENSSVVPFDDTLALAAADIALQEKLAMADDVIVATS